MINKIYSRIPTIVKKSDFIQTESVVFELQYVSLPLLVGNLNQL